MISPVFRVILLEAFPLIYILYSCLLIQSSDLVPGEHPITWLFLTLLCTCPRTTTNKSLPPTKWQRCPHHLVKTGEVRDHKRSVKSLSLWDLLKLLWLCEWSVFWLQTTPGLTDRTETVRTKTRHRYMNYKISREWKIFNDIHRSWSLFTRSKIYTYILSPDIWVRRVPNLQENIKATEF